MSVIIIVYISVILVSFITGLIILKVRSNKEKDYTKEEILAATTAVPVSEIEESTKEFIIDYDDDSEDVEITIEEVNNYDKVICDELVDNPDIVPVVIEKENNLDIKIEPVEEDSDIEIL